MAALPPSAARPLGSRVVADCAVIGAGFTGLAAARRLATHHPDWRVVVVEAERVGSGASGRNSGFLADIAHYEPRRGVEGNRQLARLARSGIEELRALVESAAIDCDWSARGALHAAVGDGGMRSLDTLRRGLEAMGEPYTWLDRTAMAGATGTSHYRAGIHLPGTVTVQPAALACGLGATLPPGVALFEESPVYAIHRGTTFTLEAGHGTIVTDRLLVAINGFTPALGLLRGRIIPMVTFASLSRQLHVEEQAALGGEREWGLVPEEPMGTTVRRTRDARILVRNTVRYAPRAAVDRRFLGVVREAHRRALRARFPMLPDLELAHTWGGCMAMTLNGGSYFGRLERNLLLAAGCNGVGVAMGTAAGRLLADLLVGADSPLLADMRALPAPTRLPPDPLLGVGVRAVLAYRAARAREET